MLLVRIIVSGAARVLWCAALAALVLATAHCGTEVTLSGGGGAAPDGGGGSPSSPPGGALAMSVNEGAASVGLDLETWGASPDMLVLQVASFANTCGSLFPYPVTCPFCGDGCCDQATVWRFSVGLRTAQQAPGTYKLTFEGDAPTFSFEEFDGVTDGEPWNGSGSHEGGLIEVLSLDASEVRYRLTNVVIGTLQPNAPTIDGEYTASRCGGGG